MDNHNRHSLKKGNDAVSFLFVVFVYYVMVVLINGVLVCLIYSEAVLLVQRKQIHAPCHV